jgi:hypothetical protein
VERAGPGVREGDDVTKETGKVARGERHSDPCPSPVSGYWKGIVPVVPSNNVFMRSHWAERKRLKDVFYLEIYYAFRDSLPSKATGKRRVRIEVVSRRQRDYLNLAGPCDKLLVDNLVKLGWLRDDNPTYLEIELAGSSGSDTRCEIEIWGEDAR